MNTTVIPGRDDSWAQQLTWQNDITNLITIIDTYLTERVSADRTTLDTLLDNLRVDLVEFNNIFTTTADTIDSSFGEPLDQTTLYGLRLLWLKNLIDVQNGGSKITLLSIAGS